MLGPLVGLFYPLITCFRLKLTFKTAILPKCIDHILKPVLLQIISLFT
jgi:hypothetical protein